MKTSYWMRSLIVTVGVLLPTFSLHAASPITLPATPLYLASGIAPNLVVTLDDSGSMAWGYVPDAMGYHAAHTTSCGYPFYFHESATGTRRYFLSGDYNAQYYNPKIQYMPPLKADGSPYSTSFAAAYLNGFNTGSGTVALGTAYQPSVGYMLPSPLNSTALHCFAEHPATDIGGPQFSAAKVNVPAYYYRYVTGGAGCSGGSISPTNEACYVYTQVTSTSGTGGTDERQNFANWYSFYRTRNLTTITAATRAFNNLPSTMRLAWQSLNSCNDFNSATCKGWDAVSKDHRIRTLSASGHKQNFYDWLVRLPTYNGTPLRAALGRSGEYFSTTSGTNNPYAEDPQVTVGTQHSCRANYTIMMTDGMWNGSAASKGTGNVDNTAKTLPSSPGPAGVTSYTPPAYTPSAPYADANSDSLADVAFYYWANDLRTDLVNNVMRSPSSFDRLVEEGKPIPTADYFDPKNDPASWQHMVTYTVGLGLTTTFPTLTPALTWAGSTYTGSYADLAAGKLAWPVVGSDKTGNVADLWHAALNGRGLFFSAEDPKTLSEGMLEIVNNIVGRSSSAAAIATNSKRLDTSTTIYQASFDSGSWTGELEAFAVTSEGLLGASQWKASTKIPASRTIKTMNGSAGVDFAWTSISPTQKTALGSEDILNYLRGNQTKEESEGGAFRTRPSLLGDIVNSDPLFVSGENYGYDKLSGLEGTDYVTYLTGKNSKAPMIYVGANDGMLHAFKASDGVEMFAYIPANVYGNLAALSKPSYISNHKYFVDGAPTVGDVYYGGTTWKTILVTPLGAGGRGVFALDVSKDFALTTFADADVLWEFDGTSTKSTPNDMGYPVGAASVGRFNDGKYYAVFGNGYGSANCKSGLFMVQIDNPSNVKYFDTLKGTCTSTGHNGMSTPSLVDYDGDRIIDAIFAGDLQGNLWKFDVSKPTWGIALAGKPMFTTVTGQPITAPVEVGPAPADATGKAMVYFGTGKYLLTGDESDKTKQAFYGLLDADKVVVNTNLQAQTIVFENATARVVSTNTIDWVTQQGWYINLVPPSGTAEGERVLSVPLLRHGRVIFNTSIPSSDPCVLGGTGWLMELDAATGASLAYNALDMNNDGAFDAKDNVEYTDVMGKKISSPVSGKKSGSMSLNQPTVITAGAKEYKFNSDIKKGITVTTEKSGTGNPRSSWRQLQ